MATKKNSTKTIFFKALSVFFKLNVRSLRHFDLVQGFLKEIIITVESTRSGPCHQICFVLKYFIQVGEKPFYGYITIRVLHP